MVNAGKSLLDLANSAESLKFLNVKNLLYNGLNLGYELTQEITQPFILVPYFEAFQDFPHRCELAFTMAKQAQLCNDERVVTQFMWHPDSWYLLQTEKETKVIFAGHLYTMARRIFKRYRHPKNLAFWDKSVLHENSFKCPGPDVADNRQNVIIYCLLLASGVFNKWKKSKEGTYDHPEWKACDLQTLMETIKNRTSFSAAAKLRSYLSHPGSLSNELQLVRAVAEFFGSKHNGMIHYDPKADALEQGL